MRGDAYTLLDWNDLNSVGPAESSQRPTGPYLRFRCLYLDGRATTDAAADIDDESVPMLDRTTWTGRLRVALGHSIHRCSADCREPKCALALTCFAGQNSRAAKATTVVNIAARASQVARRCRRSTCPRSLLAAVITRDCQG